MRAVWRHANDDDVLGGGCVKKLLPEVRIAAINDEKNGPVGGETLCTHEGNKMLAKPLK